MEILEGEIATVIYRIKRLNHRRPIGRVIQQGEFIKHYGDIGEDEFYMQGGTIPQRLLLMNGTMVHNRIENNLVVTVLIRRPKTG